MRSTIIVLSALLASSVSAGFGFGGCPTVSSVSFDNSMTTSRQHKVVYVDSYVFKGLNMLGGFISGIPSLDCFDLGAFGFDSAAYVDQFVAETTAYYSKLLYFDATTGTEVHYGCMDAKLASVLIDYVITLGIPLPSTVLKVVSKVLTLFHVDGIVVFSNSSTLDSATVSAMSSAVTAKVSKYNFSKSTSAV